MVINCWMWTMMLMFWRYILPPSSQSVRVGAMSGPTGTVNCESCAMSPLKPMECTKKLLATGVPGWSFNCWCSAAVRLVLWCLQSVSGAPGWLIAVTPPSIPDSRAGGPSGAHCILQTCSLSHHADDHAFT